MILNLYQQVDILFSILEELLNSPFNKQFDDKAKHVLSKHGLEVVEGKIIKTQRRISAEAKENGYSEPEELTEFEQRIMRLVNRTTFKKRTINEDGAKRVAALLLPYAKKQLEKQCEQKTNPVLDIEIPFGAKDSELQESTYLIPEGFHAEIKDNEVLIKKGKQESTKWNEEDEKMYNIVFEEYKNRQYYSHPTLEDYDISGQILGWLKSLKDRAQSQPKQEWKQENREELTEFENAMMHIGNSFFGENAGLDPNDTDTIKEQAELLLELAPKTEWSEEDRTMAFTLMRDVDQISYISKEGKNERIGWLNSLDEKFASRESTWSEEDELMLEKTINFIPHHMTAQSYNEIFNWFKSLKNRISYGNS